MNFSEAKKKREQGEKDALIDLVIRRNLPILNALESHLGCALCHGPLDGAICPVCQDEEGRVEDEHTIEW